jgi:hypothetical protein
MSDIRPSKEKVPGPKQPPRLHGDGCICGDHERYECPVKHRKPPSKDLYAPENVVAYLRSNASQSIAGKQYAHAADEIERLRGQLEAAEQHVKILLEQRAGFEPPVTPDPTGNWPLEVFKPLPPDEAKALREAVPEVFGEPTQPPGDARTITSLCDRLERIYLLATTGDHMDISKRLHEIAGLSGGFLTPPSSPSTKGGE